MKIIFFTNHLLGTDGWSKYSRDLVLALEKEGQQCVCLVSKIAIDLPVKQIKILRSPLHYFNNPILLFWDFFKVRKIVINENPDVVHYLVETYALFAPLLRQQFKDCLTVHGSYALLPLFSWKVGWLTRMYYQKIKMIFAISNYTKERLLECLPSVQEKIQVVPNGIAFDVKQDDLINKNLIGNLNRPNHQLIFIGAVKLRKGLLETLEALRVYKQKFSQAFVFNILGDFDIRTIYCQKLLAKIKEYDLQNNVIFHGRVSEEEKKEFLRQADLLIMLSIIQGNYFEGFGLVYLEANQFGVPVIGSNIGGPAEAIKDGYSGYVVDVYNPEEVANKMNEILNKRIINRIDCIAWSKAHDTDKVAKEVLAVYKNL